MFKVKIRKPSEILVDCGFDIFDYPLVSINLYQNHFKRKYINTPKTEVSTVSNKDEKFLLEIVVPESVMQNISGNSIQKPEAEFALKPTFESVSPGMRSVISDILHSVFVPEFKAAYLTTKVAELLIVILSAQVIDDSLKKWSEQDRAAFEKVRDLLSKNFKRTYSIEELSVVAGMNRTKLQSGFKSLFNKTIYTFALDLKMDQAKTLLTNDHHLSLKEIASMVGYSHVNHFSAAFKKKFEISPSYFKRMLDFTLPLILLLL
jgi:AraC-like DNA-binding protein